MPLASPTLFVAHFPNRQVDRIRAPQRMLSRDEQVRSAAEALRVVVSGRLHIRDAQGEMQSLHGSSFKTRPRAMNRSEKWNIPTIRPPRRGRMSRSSTDTALSPHSLCHRHSIQSLSMRPLVSYSATSLDGYIAGPTGEIGWPFTESGDQKQEPPRVDFFNSLLGG